MQASAIHKGTVMQGEYLLLEAIPDAAGEVFRGRSKRGGRAVTIRLWRGSAGAAAERVLEKPQVAGRLQHPMIAAVEACGRESDGTWFIVSEAVPGQPLSDWADEVGIPPIGSVVEYVHRLCQGLSAAHREGLEHDALNPDNVVVFQQEAGALQRLSGKILELGVPAFMYPSPPSLRAAQFMAPEQLAACMRLDGAPLNADARMNVYSCGCLLYYLCTGGPPFPSRSLEELTHAHAEGKLVPPSKINPQLSPSLESVILRALALQRSERHVGVAELAKALTRVRLSTSSSGVRLLGESQGGRSQPSAFDERPTSETEQPSQRAGKTLAPPPAPGGSVNPPEFQGRSAKSTLESQEPAGTDPLRDLWSTPAGSFSSAPPASAPPLPSEARHAAAARAFSSGLAVPQSPLPPPRSQPPRRPPPISAVATPITSELSARLFSASDEPNRSGLPVLLAEHEQSGSSLPVPYTSYDDELGSHAPARRGSTKIWLGAVAAAACCAVAFWALDKPARPAPEERALLQPSAPPALALQPELAPPEPPPPAVEPAAVGAVVAVPEEQVTATPDPSEPRAVDAAVQGARPRRSVARASVRRASAGHRADAEDDNGEAASAEGEPTALQTVATPGHALPLEVAAPAPSAEPAPEPEPAPASKPHAVVVQAPAKTPPPAPAFQPKLPLAAGAEIQAVVVKGSLATSVVVQAVDRIRPEFSACYARAANAAGRNGFGEVTVEVQIDERGRAEHPTASGASLPGLAACVAEVAGKLASRRPPDTGTVKASWKVVFAP
jgi:serine/threonine protein kinase